MSWARFAADEGRLAEFLRERLHGRVAYLATIAPGGAPRVHPVTPVIDGRRLLVFMEPSSPKGRDLQRDSRYALHCGVEDARGGGGEVLVRGRGVVRPSSDDAASTGDTPDRPASRYVTFELSVDDIIVTRAGSEGPRHTRWRAPRSSPPADSPGAAPSR